MIKGSQRTIYKYPKFSHLSHIKEVKFSGVFKMVPLKQWLEEMELCTG